MPSYFPNPGKPGQNSSTWLFGPGGLAGAVRRASAAKARAAKARNQGKAPKPPKPGA